MPMLGRGFLPTERRNWSLRYLWSTDISSVIQTCLEPHISIELFANSRSETHFELCADAVVGAEGRQVKTAFRRWGRLLEQVPEGGGPA